METSESKPSGASWNCREKGHFNGLHVTQIINGMDLKQDAERNYADIIINGVEVKQLADSGSDSTIITHEDWMKMGQPTLTRCRDASAVNGTSIRLYGYFHTEFCCTLAPRCGSGMCYISDNIRVMGRGWLNQAIPEHLQALKIICASIARPNEPETGATPTVAELQRVRHINLLKRRIAKLQGEGISAKILQKEPRQGLRGTTMQSQPPVRRSTRIRHKLRKLDLDPHMTSYRP
uniref:Peptidase A2 domain-containing protein n=1 Tax=Plectus sambesii TaxID=2011161 RepID=A0A914VIZ6_9BILA